jgi:hypothetical protein
MITDIVIAIISGIITTISLSLHNVQLTINTIYIILLTTSWSVFLMSILHNRKTYFMVGILGLIISYYAIQKQLFIDKGELYKDIINTHVKSLEMSKTVAHNGDLHHIKKRDINNLIKEEEEHLKIIRRNIN